MSRPRATSAARGLVIPLLCLATSACYPYPSHARSPTERRSWSFHVVVPEDGAGDLSVDATFREAGTERLSIEPRAMPHVHLEALTHGQGRRWLTIERADGGWAVPACRNDCTVRYRINLAELAAGCGDEVVCARRVRHDAVLSPALAWLVRPTPARDAVVTVEVQVPDASAFATGLRRASDRALPAHPVFTFRSGDLDEGSFTAFGTMRRYPVHVPQRPGTRARVELAILGSVPYASPDVRLRSWVEDGAGAVSTLFGRFPVDRATIFVVPAEGKADVSFGRVLSLAGSSVAIVVGDRTPPSALERDRLLVHELIHLGFPTFRGEGRWLSEGLATYYEPILRARAQMTSHADVFQGFARRMPTGEPPKGTATPLVDRRDPDGIYWGGAIFCLAADVQIRARTEGRRSLDDVVRAILDRGGDATQVWGLRDVFRIGDRVTGTTVLTDMFEHHALAGERIDLDALFESLGVVATEQRRSVTLNDSAPLAWIRRDLTAARPGAALALRDDQERRR